MALIQNYRGYAVHASAHRLQDKSFSANVLLERADENFPETQYRFYALDYFPREAEAIEYSRRWACDWIDTRG